MKTYKYNYFYKITNNINGNFYYGIHSTDNLDDGYMGSGSRLRYAYKKYGVENFTKEILQFFDTREELSDYEATVVNENLIVNENCYNISLGGDSINLQGTFNAYDSVDKTWRRITDEEYSKNPERYSLTSIFCNKVLVKNKNDLFGKYILIDKEEFYKNRENYIYKDDWKKNNMIVLDKRTNKKVIISNEEFDSNYHTAWPDLFQPGQIVVKDKDGNKFKVYSDDSRYLSGELVIAYTGYKWSDEQKEKLKNKFKQSLHQKGEKNSQFGTKWIYKDSECIKVKKDVLQTYLDSGWKLGCLKTRKR